jgi:uncharacterized SAM-binding protein YcdF (DUF218 family)
MSILMALALPSGWALLLLLAGLLAALFRRRALSWGLLAAAGLVAQVFSSGMVASALMSPLEYAYPAVMDGRSHPDTRHIVVLTAWGSDDPAMPLTGRLNSSSAYRLLMALELARDRPDCDVIVSGGRTPARLMARSLEKLGVPHERVRIEDGSDSTAESAARLRAFVGEDPFFLVTSGGHMPRSMDEMNRHGLRAIPVPTDHQLPRDWRKADWMPTPTSLYASDLAMHEHLSRLWRRIRS